MATIHRNRPTLVCHACKKRKIKCDRGRPCASCVKYNLDCSYEPVKKESQDNLKAHFTPAANNDTTSKVSKPLYSQQQFNDVVVLKKSEVDILRQKALLYDELHKNPQPHPHPHPSNEIYQEEHQSQFEKQLHQQFPLCDNQQPSIPSDFSPSPFSPETVSSSSSYSVTSITVSDTYTAYNHVPSYAEAAGLVADKDLVSAYKVGINPFENEQETIDLYQRSNPTAATGTYALSWYATTRKDPWRSFIYLYLKYRQTENELGSLTITSETDSSNDTSKVSRFIKRALNDQFSADLPILLNGNGSKGSMALTLTLFGDGNISHELKLVEQIKAILPTKRTVEGLLDRFFARLYHAWPYLDEMDFRANLDRILGSAEDDETFENLTVKTRLDFAYLGTLLIILRMAYLSLLSNSSKMKTSHDEQYDYLVRHPVDIQAASVALLCFHQFEFMKQVRLPILQCALYLMVYMLVSPEEGVGFDKEDTLVYHHTVVGMAFSLGLNRDPDQGRTSTKNSDFQERQNNLKRKIWHRLVVYDFFRSLISGFRPCIRRNDYDTKYPYHSANNSNLRDARLDQIITERFECSQHVIGGPLTNLLDIFYDVNAEVKVSDIVKYFNDHEVVSYAYCGTLVSQIGPLLGDYFGMVDKMTRTINSTVFQSFNVIVYFNLFSHYETRNNRELCQFYYEKMYRICVIDICPSLVIFLTDPDEVFGPGHDIISNAALLDVMKKEMEVLIFGICRFNSLIYKCLQSPDHNSRLLNDSEYREVFRYAIEMSSVLEKWCKLCLYAASMLRERYYSAWMISKSYNCILGIITSEKFYQAAGESVADSLFNDWKSQKLKSMAECAQITLNGVIDTMKKSALFDFCEVTDKRGYFPYEYKEDYVPFLAPFVSSLKSDIQEPSILTESELLYITEFTQRVEKAGTREPHADSNLSHPLNEVNSSEVDQLWLHSLMQRAKIIENESFDFKQSPLFSEGAQFDYFSDMPLEQILGFQ